MVLRNFTNKEIIWSQLIVSMHGNSFQIYLQVPHVIHIEVKCRILNVGILKPRTLFALGQTNGNKFSIFPFFSPPYCC